MLDWLLRFCGRDEEHWPCHGCGQDMTLAEAFRESACPRRKKWPQSGDVRRKQVVEAVAENRAVPGAVRLPCHWSRQLPQARNANHIVGGQSVEAKAAKRSNA